MRRLLGVRIERRSDEAHLGCTHRAESRPRAQGTASRGGKSRKDSRRVDASPSVVKVPKRGLEPPLPNGNQLLKLARLPFRHIGKTLRKRLKPSFLRLLRQISSLVA